MLLKSHNIFKVKKGFTKFAYCIAEYMVCSPVNIMNDNGLWKYSVVSSMYKQ